MLGKGALNLAAWVTIAGALVVGVTWVNKLRFDVDSLNPKAIAEQREEAIIAIRQEASRFKPSGAHYKEFFLTVEAGTSADEVLVHTTAGVCFLAGFNAQEGDLKQVLLTVRRHEGYWYLSGRASKAGAFRAKAGCWLFRG